MNLGGRSRRSARGVEGRRGRDVNDFNTVIIHKDLKKLS